MTAGAQNLHTRSCNCNTQGEGTQKLGEWTQHRPRSISPHLSAGGWGRGGGRRLPGVLA